MRTHRAGGRTSLQLDIVPDTALLLPCCPCSYAGAVGRSTKSCEVLALNLLAPAVLAGIGTRIQSATSALPAMDGSVVPSTPSRHGEDRRSDGIPLTASLNEHPSVITAIIPTTRKLLWIQRVFGRHLKLGRQVGTNRAMRLKELICTVQSPR